MTGLGVATGSRSAIRPLERPEPGDANLPAPGNLSDDGVENGLEGVRGDPAAAKLGLQGADQFCLVHVFPPEDCRCPATRRASGSSPVTNDGRPTEGRGPSSGATFPLCRNDFGRRTQACGQAPRHPSRIWPEWIPLSTRGIRLAAVRLRHPSGSSPACARGASSRSATPRPRGAS